MDPTRARKTGARHAREGRECRPHPRWDDATRNAYSEGYAAEPNPGPKRRPLTDAERDKMRLRLRNFVHGIGAGGRDR